MIREDLVEVNRKMRMTYDILGPDSESHNQAPRTGEKEMGSGGWRIPPEPWLVEEATTHKA